MSGRLLVDPEERSWQIEKRTPFPTEAPGHGVVRSDPLKVQPVERHPILGPLTTSRELTKGPRFVRIDLSDE